MRYGVVFGGDPQGVQTDLQALGRGAAAPRPRQPLALGLRRPSGSRGWTSLDGRGRAAEHQTCQWVPAAPGLSFSAWKG
ncbi:MAG: hypothetical protein EOO40_09625 [Deltaproteobacteria bacterium]|nr:MAG: hypothetical protein EOO40_09625 [Deltaproteobacteria bacterium]